MFVLYMFILLAVHIALCSITWLGVARIANIWQPENVSLLVRCWCVAQWPSFIIWSLV